MSGCRNTLYFNPNNIDTAKEVSARIGECDCLHHTWSRSGALLMKPTRTQHRQKVPLVTPDEINRFGKGKFVMFAPGYQSQDGTQAAIPVLARPKLNQAQIDEQTTAGHIWDKKSKQRLVALRENDPTYISDPDQALAKRRAAVDKLLPKAPTGDDEHPEVAEATPEDRATAEPEPVDTNTPVEQLDATQEAIAMLAALKK